MVAISGRAELACGGAADDLDPRELSLHFLRDRIEIVLDRAKEQNKRRVGLRYAPMKLANRFPGVFVAGLPPAYRRGRLDFRLLLSQPLLNS